MDGGKELFSMEAGGKVFGFGTTDPAGLLGEEELRRIFSEINYEIGRASCRERV